VTYRLCQSGPPGRRHHRLRDANPINSGAATYQAVRFSEVYRTLKVDRLAILAASAAAPANAAPSNEIPSTSQCLGEGRKNRRRATVDRSPPFDPDFRKRSSAPPLAQYYGRDVRAKPSLSTT